MIKLRYMAAPMMALAFCTAAAVAQTAPAPDPTAVTVPYGDIMVAAKDAAITAVVLGLGWAMRSLPAAVVQFLTTMQAEQLIKRALEFGFNAVAGAMKGKTLTVDVGNAVVAAALQYIVDRAPAWLIGWLGGQSAIKAMLIARLDLEPDARVTRPANGPPVLTK